MKKSFLSPKNLKALRGRKNWSQVELAKISHLTARSISEWEKTDADQISVQKKSFSGLRKALGTSEEILSGQAELPVEIDAHEVSLKLDAQTRLNYDLLEKRYGITLEEIVAAAPLFLVKAAEESLIQQSESIDADVEKVGKAWEMWQLLPEVRTSVDANSILHLDADVDWRGVLESRRMAVARRDIFETSVDDIEYDFDDPQCDANPFAQYMSGQCNALPSTKIDEDDHYGFLRAFSGTRIPVFAVCEDLLEQITLGSKDAKLALTHGIVSIHEISAKFWEPREAGNRVAWLEDRFRIAQEEWSNNANLDDEDV
jgi:transcriptional regulator with XRE-family HTH domain